VPDLPPHLYAERGVAEGHSRAVVDKAAAEWGRLRARGLVPVLTLGHLARLAGVSHRYLREIVERTRDPYLDIVRLKRDGTIRPISSPEPVLMEVQRWILHNVLRPLAPHQVSFAYHRGRSIVQCAEQHVGARWLVKLDLHDFFGTVDEARAYRVFQDLGYARLVSFELARICTRMRGDRQYGVGMPRVIRSYAVARQGVLPQGAPTSGALANAAARGLDGQLVTVAAEYGAIYTRYSDDLVFSAGASFDRAKAAALIGRVSEAVSDTGFVVHRKKTRVVPPGARHVVLGLVLGHQQVQLMPEFKRRVDVHIRGVSRFGLAEHARHRGFRSIISFVNHVDGCLAFAAAVEPEHAAKARRRWNEALISAGYPA
jgi:RNA-directed DNA polymerase